MKKSNFSRKTYLFIVSLLMATQSYSQNSKIDSVKRIYYHCLPDSLGVMYPYAREVEFETCSENECHLYTKWYRYSKDTLLTDYYTEKILASTKERLSTYWSRDQFPHYQELEFTYEKFFEDTKTYFYVEVNMEIHQPKPIPKDEYGFAQNIQSRNRSGYQLEPFYAISPDSTTIRAMSYVKVSQFNDEGATNLTSEIAPEFEQYVRDSISGKTEFDITTIRSLAGHTMQQLNDSKLTREREVELDTSSVFKRFVALPFKLYTETDKKRPFRIRKRDKRYKQIEKGKNHEVWVLGEGECEHVVYEIYTKP